MKSELVFIEKQKYAHLAGHSADKAIFCHLGMGYNVITLGQIESVWQTTYPKLPFSYYFLDDGLKATYSEEARIGKIYTTFCSLALFIACMGLFALAPYTIRKRLKEISGRKVLGASLSEIMLLIYSDFLILIAFLIATPASILIFRNWLSGFAYHIGLSPLYFAIAATAVILISGLTLLFQLVKAGQVNPAAVLKKRIAPSANTLRMVLLKRCEEVKRN